MTITYLQCRVNEITKKEQLRDKLYESFNQSIMFGIANLGKFKIEKIKLTPETLGSPIYALGLKPITPHGVPILIFKGTTFPQDNGSLGRIHFSTKYF